MTNRHQSPELCEICKEPLSVSEDSGIHDRSIVTLKCEECGIWQVDFNFGAGSELAAVAHVYPRVAL